MYRFKKPFRFAEYSMGESEKEGGERERERRGEERASQRNFADTHSFARLQLSSEIQYYYYYYYCIIRSRFVCSFCFAFLNFQWDWKQFSVCFLRVRSVGFHQMCHRILIVLLIAMYGCVCVWLRTRAISTLEKSTRKRIDGTGETFQYK